jgi:glycosyltransferase involved in cell wall biosynthesis
MMVRSYDEDCATFGGTSESANRGSQNEGGIPVPRVSVVIPTWERGRWLRRALDSVFAQTEADFEVLVIDDGSPTNVTEEVVTACGDSRVRYQKLPEHRGVAAARNAGLRSATAKYVAFLDDDDEWLPEKLERQIAVIEACDTAVGAVYTARFSIDERTRQISTMRFATGFRPEAANVVTTSSIVVRRDCFSRVGMFDERFEAGSDYEMWIRLALHYEFVYIDVPLVKYYIHTNSLSAAYGKKRRAAELLLKKHGAFFSRDRRWLARQYAQLGVMCYRDGDVMASGRAFLAAVRLSPFEPATYACGLRTLLTVRRSRRASRQAE